MKPLVTPADSDSRSRRNWTACWLLATCILAIELAFLLSFADLANRRLHAAPSSPAAAYPEKIKPAEGPRRGACRGVFPLKVQAI